MEKYRVTVERLEPQNEENKYERYQEIYVQSVEKIDLKKIIDAVNAGE